MRIRALIADENGAAAVEMALIGSIFCAGLLNVAEVTRYAFIRTEVATATQAAAQAAYVTCDAAHQPATLNCPDLNTAVTRALRSTSLGANVTLSGALQEAYYCLNGTGELQYAADVTGSKQADCSAFGNAAAKPQPYVRVNTTYTYAPMFGTLSVARAFPTTVARTAWMRMS